MANELNDRKALLRQEIRSRLEALSLKQRQLAAGAIGSRLREFPGWQTATSVLLFAPMVDEPDIWPLATEALQAGKTVGLPRFIPETQVYAAARVTDLELDVKSGKFGIREPAPHCPPVPLEAFGLVLVPGMAFDQQGHRLGRGRGYYDRLLAEVRGVKCGVAYDEQIVSEVPVETLDVRLDAVVTPQNFWSLNQI